MKIKSILAIMILTLSALIALPASANDTEVKVTGTSKYDRYIIQGKNGSLKHVIQEFGSAKRLFGDFAVAIGDVEEIADSLQSSSKAFGQVVITPDLMKKRYIAPNDPYWSYQWDMGSDSTYGIDLLAAHDLFTTKEPGQDAVVAVLDTGFTDHPDLLPSYQGGYDFLQQFDPWGDPQSNDGDGPDTDPHDAGDYWLENTYGGPWGSSWHGTHVHGTITAAKGNNVGIIGVAPNAEVIHGRVLGVWGGWDSEIAASIRWAAGLAVSGVPINTKPADVINLSLGGEYPTCPAIYSSAIAAARNAGTVVVIAAGNSNADASQFTPANCTDAITVAATGPAGYRAYYSNYGSVVDIAAPGGDASYSNGGILSTLNTGYSTPQTPNYVFYQGTSMATPHVAGVAALIRSANPDLTVAQVESMLLASVNTFRADSSANSCSQSGKCGSGLLDAQKAVAAALASVGGGGGGVLDTQVRDSAVLVASGKATISWSAPANTTNLSGYRVTVSGVRNACTTAVSQLTCTFNRLKNGQSYTALVEAKYGLTYATGISLTFVPAGIPSSLKISKVTAGAGSLVVVWKAANPNGSAILGYRIEVLTSSNAVAGFCETILLTCTITGLPSGSYRVKLVATNSIGSATVISRSSYRVR